MSNKSLSVSDKENVARILCREWFEGDKLLNVAFALRYRETYLSVNRPAIETFNDDIAFFIKTHSLYAFDEDNTFCRLATMNVGGVKNIKVELDGKNVDIDVTVEPRDTKIQSHAGIFTRYNDCNLKMGDTINIQQEAVPVDDILLKVRLRLMRLVSVEQHKIK